MAHHQIDLAEALQGTFDPYDCDRMISSFADIKRICDDVDEIHGREYATAYRGWAVRTLDHLLNCPDSTPWR